VLAVVLFAAAAPHALAKKPKLQACPAGRFLVAASSAPLLSDVNPAVDALATDAQGHVSLDGCGPATVGTVTAHRRFTLVQGAWTTCGSFTKVRVTARIPSPACDALTGKLRARKTKRKVFPATRSACGDGRLDTVGGEACDASVPGGDQACPGACGAPGGQDACRCPGGSTGLPIVAPAGQWTWVDFPDTACDDGSPTGLGIRPSSSSTDTLIFLNGGGACWDYTTCYVFNTAAHGPFGAAQFAARSAALTGSILDSQLAGNPFAGWNMIFIPYCTGDTFAGNNVATYQDAAQTVSKQFHHVGHANVLAYLARLAPTFPGAGKVVFAGSSAGGFGALINYPDARTRWPDSQVYLLDDSGPPLEGAAIPAAEVAAWLTNWRLDLVLDPLCGAEASACHGDLSLALAKLVALRPTDRMALLSSLQDGIIRTFFALSPTDFQTDLLALAADRLDPTSAFRYFFVTGDTHTMLGSPAAFSQGTTSLLPWLTQFVTDDPGWASVKP